MLEIGHSYSLSVVRQVNIGVYLDADNLGEVLLPREYLDGDVEVGDSIRVFLYLDSEGRVVATTETPLAQVGEIAYLKVLQVNEFGAFLDWGLKKDLFAPFGEQFKNMFEDKFYLVYVYIDNMGRITASSKINKFLDRDEHRFQKKQVVDIVVANTTDLGFNAVINNSHWGVLYQNEVFETLSYGQKKRAYIKEVRLDGKIDLILQGGKESRDNNSKIVEDYLIGHQGFCKLNDKSSPEDITEMFGMSKGAYKKTLGGLYKAGVIRIEKDGVYLVK